MSFGPRASFEYLPRVGLLGIRVRAGSIAEILRQAALSLSVVLLSEQPRSGPEYCAGSCSKRRIAPRSWWAG